MLKSIENVSKEIGISKATIYKKLKNDEYKKYIVKENGKMMLNDKIVEKLKRDIRKKKVENIEDVEILLNQLKEKNAQIDRLHDLIENNQLLIKHHQEKEKEQLKLEEHFREIDKKLIEIRNQKKEKAYFKRVF